MKTGTIIACIVQNKKQKVEERIKDPAPKAIWSAVVGLQVGLALKPLCLQDRAKVITPHPMKPKLMGDETGESSAIQSTSGEQPERWAWQGMQSWQVAQPANSPSEQTDRPTSGRGVG